MSSPRGCFKTGCFGCLGSLALLLLIVGVISILAWNDVKKSDLRDEQLAPLVADSSPLLEGQKGRVILDMAQAEFKIFPAEPGEGLRVDAVYDDALYDLQQQFSALPDSSWQFELSFKRTTTGMRAILQSVFAKGPSTKIHIYLPPDVPVELEAQVAQGGLECDFGGLWLTSADIRMKQGGGAIQFSEPTKEPMSGLRVRWAMGGGAIVGVGNASPAVLDVSSSMGGADVELSGPWARDCEVKLYSKMGGMTVRIPSSVKVKRGAKQTGLTTPSEDEVLDPTLYLRTEAQFGNVEVVH